MRDTDFFEVVSKLLIEIIEKRFAVSDKLYKYS